MAAWDILVDRKDLRRIEMRPAPDPAPLGEGEARLEVERFALTANNITYGIIGDSFGYWKFFPAADGLGRIPVWGFAKVVESRAAEIPVGLRLFGYLPMSTHFTARLTKGRHGYVDAATHRAELPPTYNAYAEAPADALDDHRALLRPLFMTSWLLDDLLSDDANVASLVLSSASSKTAMGLASLARKRGVEVIGLTSPGNADKLAQFGLYDRVVTYDQLDSLSAKAPASYVDFAGNPQVTRAAHTALGDGLTRSLIVGVTHWKDGGAAGDLPGPTPTLFFAPDQIRKRAAEWGAGELDARFDTALRGFVAEADWLSLTHHTGPDALMAAYADVLEGRARPDEGHIIRPV
ncbi:MAG: DUF2855 family protein [Phenylobacterium sp.]|uniref:DUF2855 family protein n=1 Tax=Phenylobacterium sp. TaxID=1871053 RepID=UPI0027363FED|nr:DUF2855 family protein [Phenylobacterium sp.]MDP3749114.1 DUF2855 family protein [Phenylobacterium sp.]